MQCGGGSAGLNTCWMAIKGATQSGSGERIAKYHGLGNDFLILDRRSNGRDLEEQAVRALCDRRHGLGADGVLVLMPSDLGAARMVVHNSDGSIAEMCGNGIRCVVKYLSEQSASRPEEVRVETDAGLMRCKVEYRDGAVQEVQVSMGPARLVADNLPPQASDGPFVDREVPGFPGIRGSAVSMGNPHLVLFGTPLSEAGKLGPKLEHHRDFREGTNVDFAQIVGQRVELRVWERGCGLTQACGTGACATVAAAVAEKRLPPNEWIRVSLPGGDLLVRAATDLSSLEMRGPATFVFEAELALPAPA